MGFYLYINDYNRGYISDIEELPRHLEYYKKLIKISEEFYKLIGNIQFFTIDPREADVEKYIYNCSTFFKCVVTFDINFSENLKGINILNCTLESEEGFEEYDKNKLDSDDPF